MASQLLNTVRELLSHIRNDSTHKIVILSNNGRVANETVQLLCPVQGSIDKRLAHGEFG